MRFIDPDLARKNRLLSENINQQIRGNDYPLFSVLEFNLCGLCTRKCIFCPHSNPDYPRVDEYISLELFEGVMQDLQNINFDGTVLFSAFSEPLLHKEVEKLIALSKKYCPKARVEIITNGDLVTLEKLSGLFAAGLTTLCVSMYDGPHQLDHFKALQRQLGLKDEQLVLRTRWLSAQEHYGITLTNRAGAIEIKEVGITAPAEPIKRPCYYPFFQTLIDYDGSVLLCTHDWNKKLKVGDVNYNSILEIWSSNILNEVRLNLARSNRDFQPCDLCSADGLFMGWGHFEKWMKYYETAS